MSELPSTESTGLLAAAIAAVHSAILEQWNTHGEPGVSEGLTAAALVLEAVLAGVRDERLIIVPLAVGDAGVLWINGTSSDQ